MTMCDAEEDHAHLPDEKRLTKSDADKLGLHIMECMLNDNTAPPKKPTTLSDVSNMELLDHCTQMATSGAKIDMGIISNTVVIEARFDKVDFNAQALFRSLKKLLDTE